ncbi:MAG TPA: hypothetical protein VF832_03670, partial [Longimicrobiales bacterium]
TYLIGLRKSIQNRGPIVGPPGVAGWYNNDMYFKGANMLMTIREVVHDDARWRRLLRGLNHTFWHRTVTGAEVQQYMSHAAGLDLDPLFRQYLATTDIPALEYRLEPGLLAYRWTQVVPGFAMPVRVTIPGLGPRLLHPTATWRTLRLPRSAATRLDVDPRFYVTARPVAASADSTR